MSIVSVCGRALARAAAWLGRTIAARAETAPPLADPDQMTPAERKAWDDWDAMQR